MTALIVQDVLLFTGNLQPECECVKESPLIVALQRTHLWEGAAIQVLLCPHNTVS